MTTNESNSVEELQIPRNFAWNKNVAQLFVDETIKYKKPPNLEELQQLCKEKSVDTKRGEPQESIDAFNKHMRHKAINKILVRALNDPMR